MPSSGEAQVNLRRLANQARQFLLVTQPREPGVVGDVGQFSRLEEVVDWNNEPPAGARKTSTHSILYMSTPTRCLDEGVCAQRRGKTVEAHVARRRKVARNKVTAMRSGLTRWTQRQLAEQLCHGVAVMGILLGTISAVADELAAGEFLWCEGHPTVAAVIHVISFHRWSDMSAKSQLGRRQPAFPGPRSRRRAAVTVCTPMNHSLKRATQSSCRQSELRTPVRVFRVFGGRRRESLRSLHRLGPLHMPLETE